MCGKTCVRTASASLPVLVADSEDLLYAVVHGFGKPAELLTLLFPVIKQNHRRVNVQSSSPTDAF